MRGFVLAAGFGTRLRPLTDHLPKALVPVCGIPLMERALRSFVQHDITELAVNSHYLASQIDDFRKKSAVPFRIFHEEKEIRGTGGALYFAREFLGGDDTFAVWNADIVSTVELGVIARQFVDSNAIAGLIAVPGGERKTILYDRRTDRYLGTPRDTEGCDRAGGAEFIGIALYRREFLTFLRDNDVSVVPVWKRAVESGADIRVFSAGRAYWRDTGTPLSLAQIHYDVCTGHLSLSVPSWMTVDTQTRRAYRCDMQSVSNVGGLSWVETEALPSDCTVSTSIIMQGSSISHGRRDIRNRIITTWGEMEI